MSGNETRRCVWHAGDSGDDNGSDRVKAGASFDPRTEFDVSTRVPKLPTLPRATARFSVWDGIRLLLWRILGYTYATSHATSATARLYALGFTLLWGGVLIGVLAFPFITLRLLGAFSPAFLVSAAVFYGLAMLVLAVQTRMPRVRTYMSRDRRAALVVKRTARGWKVEEFFTAAPGTGAAAPLWREVVPALVEAADAHQVHVRATAMNADVAKRYAAKVPGLRPTKPTSRGPRVPMARPPQ